MVGGGLYLITNPLRENGELVVAVGWAESDYWAHRVFELPFRGDLTPPAAQWRPPSLAFLGRPVNLSFGTITKFEDTLKVPKKVFMVSASYRWTDGAFMCVSVRGNDGLTYMYASNEPQPDDGPVAIEIRLPEAKRGLFDRLLRRPSG